MISTLLKNDRRRIAAVLLAAAGLNGVLSALEWPSLYALTHMVIDYRFGFGKRGLLGCLLSVIDHPPYHYATLAWMAFAVFAAWLILLAFIMGRLARRTPEIGDALLLFLLSLGFASLVCDVGRGEHFGILLALVCLLLPVGLPGLGARAVLLVMAVLIHEANFLIVAPLVGFDTWLGAPTRKPARATACAAMVVLPATGWTAWLGNARAGCRGAEQIAYLQHRVADFTIDPIPLATLCNDGRANFDLTLHAFWMRPHWSILFWLALVLALPSTVLNLVLLARIVRRRGLVAVGVAASLSPIVLMAVGVDAVGGRVVVDESSMLGHRMRSSLLVLAAAARRLGPPAGGWLPVPPRWKAAVAAVALLELASAMPLNDGQAPLKFPYTALWQRVTDIAEGSAKFVVHP